jgi:hypothetical protein
VSDQPPAWDPWNPQGQQQYPAQQLHPQAQPPLAQQVPGQYQGPSNPPYGQQTQQPLGQQNTGQYQGPSYAPYGQQTQQPLGQQNTGQYQGPQYAPYGQQLQQPPGQQLQQPFGQQDSGQYQGPSYAPYGQQSPQPAFTQNMQYRRIGQPPGQARLDGPPNGQPPPPGQQPDFVAPPGHRGPQRSWVGRHKVLTAILAVAALGAAVGIGRITASDTSGNTGAEPGPTVTVTTTAQAVAQAAPTVTVTKTVAPTANAQGEATQISADGVYVIGTDISGGTWHTSGGQQCYEATLASTDTSNIIDNNNFTGPDTVSLAGAVAFQITGGCVWQHEG